METEAMRENDEVWAQVEAEYQAWVESFSYEVTSRKVLPYLWALVGDNYDK
jgi:hypothetical protein